MAHVLFCAQQDRFLARQRSTPDMRTPLFDPARHWRKSSQWFVLNRRCVRKEEGVVGSKKTGAASVDSHRSAAPNRHASPAPSPQLPSHCRHADLVAQDRELLPVFGKHCFSGQDETGR